MNCVSNKASMLIVKFTQLAETEPDVKKAVKFFSIFIGKYVSLFTKVKCLELFAKLVNDFHPFIPLIHRVPCKEAAP